jgi:hypothetical protein
MNASDYRPVSFSLWTVIAATLPKQKTQPFLPDGLGQCFPAMHGQTGRSGCTPAEPYPPSCTFSLALTPQNENPKH